MSISRVFSLDKLYKNLTLFLFFILPNKITNTFVNLSIIAVIYDIRNTTLTKGNVNTDKIQHLLHISISEEILLLPNYTMHWFWDENFLNTKTIIHEQEYTLKDVIKDSDLFFKNMRSVIDLFVNHLPNSLKLKIGANRKSNRIMIRHNLMNILIYS